MVEAAIELERYAKTDVNNRVREAEEIELGLVSEAKARPGRTEHGATSPSMTTIVSRMIDESNALIEDLKHEAVLCRWFLVCGVALLFSAILLSQGILVLPAIGFTFLGAYHYHKVRKYVKQGLELMRHVRD